VSLGVDKKAHFCHNFDTKMIKRLLFYKLQKYIDSKEAIVITGMRQVGKTTLMRQMFEELGTSPKLWFDFDNPIDQKIFEDVDYNNIFKRLQNLANSDKFAVFVDEIQNFPEITKIIKYLIDHYSVKFIVTGSSNYYMKNLFPESLSGRKFIFDLAPMNFQEYLYFKESKKIVKVLKYSELDIDKVVLESNIFDHKKYETYYNEYLEFGGFPGVVVAKDIEEKKMILKNIFKSFFEKDIKMLNDYSDIRELRDLILLLVPRVGSMLDISKIASELGVKRSKIYSYIEFLQGIYIIKLLPKFSESVDKSIAGGKKVYFSDTGLLRSIGDINEAQTFENTLANQLSQYGDVSFYNKRNTSEIDFIINKEIAFEAKLTGTEDYLKTLKKLSSSLNINKAFIVSKHFREEEGIISPTIF